MVDYQDGRPNWETGEVNLWLNNEQVYYDYLCRQLIGPTEVGAIMLKDLCYDILEDFGNCFYLNEEQLDLVDWNWIIEYNREDD